VKKLVKKYQIISSFFPGEEMKKSSIGIFFSPVKKPVGGFFTGCEKKISRPIGHTAKVVMQQNKKIDKPKPTKGKHDMREIDIEDVLDYFYPAPEGYERMRGTVNLTKPEEKALCALYKIYTARGIPSPTPGNPLPAIVLVDDE